MSNALVPAPSVAPRPRPSRLARWWRRRPVNRALVVAHRWAGLVLGLLLVIETTSGAVLLYHGDWFRATNSAFYQHTETDRPLSMQQAVDAVKQAHPEFPTGWVSDDAGTLVVGNPTDTLAYAVDPGSGHVTGPVELTGGWMGFLANLHDCGLACETYPGYLPLAAAEVWPGGLSWGGLVLTVLGLLMILLIASGVKIWWPGLRRLATRFTVRWDRGRFARDYDLHNVIAMVSLPFALMWGVTGAAFELPAVEDAWLVLTGGTPADPDAFTFTANPAPATAPTIDLPTATATALAQAPGRPAYVMLPTPDTPYYSVAIKTGIEPYGYRPLFGGDVYVRVDAHDRTHTKAVSSQADPAANRFYDRVLEPAHFGWDVNGWWRLIWFVFGLAPLALMITGVSTWLWRSAVQRRRKQARA